MNDSTAIAAIRAYLDLLVCGVAFKQQDISTLAELLDRLALAYHTLPDGCPAEQADPPERDHQAFRRLAGTRFPGFGYYNIAAAMEQVGAADVAVAVADAIDDLADIAVDLSEVLWRWENIGADDAVWSYKLLYRVHWGRHLHNLRSYVHHVIFEK